MVSDNNNANGNGEETPFSQCHHIVMCVRGARKTEKETEKKTWLNRSFVRQIWTAIKALLVHCKHYNHLLAVECVCECAMCHWN